MLNSIHKEDLVKQTCTKFKSNLFSFFTFLSEVNANKITVCHSKLCKLKVPVELNSHLHFVDII